MVAQTQQTKRQKSQKAERISRKKRSRNTMKRKGSGSGGGQINPNLIQVSEPRECPCPLHETFWVTVESSQVYAFPKCRKRAYDARKKQALGAFLYTGLVRLGTAADKAAQIALRAVARFYTRYLKLIEGLGWHYETKTCTWKQNYQGVE